MNLDRIKRLFKQKESIHLEFKEALMALPGNLFETICAMLNRDGGDILLGVDDKGNVLGVNDTEVHDTKTDSINDTLNDTINDLINDTINDTISGPIRGRLSRLLKLVLAQPGLKISELTQKLGISESTTKRDLERIRILIEYKGSKKTGGYFPTDYLNSKLDEG